MRITRKHNSCLNCNATLDKAYNYCPRCGQINNDNNVSFGTLATDFFSNYFALDSRFAHSFKPFFIKPGYLTNRFNEGKRMSYANPVRLYLIISVFFFFIFTRVGKEITADDETSVKTQKSEVAKTDIGDTSDISIKELNELKETTGIGFKPIMKNLSKEHKKRIIDNIGVDSAAQFYLFPKDTISRISNTPDSLDMDFLGDGKFNWDLYEEHLKKNDELTGQQILDSIYFGNASDFELLIAKQKIKVERTETEYFAGFALKNLPIMMFLLLPIFALILKLLYIRRKVLYIRHLIHALHLHSFAYFAYGITLLISHYLIPDENVAVFVNMFSFVLVSTYAYISFLRVYKQHWFKTLIKFNIQGFVYAIVLMSFFVVELGISFLLY